MKLQLRLGAIVALALFAILTTAPAFGQSTTGSITGLVTDADGATALPGAVVSAVHEPTGTKYSSVSRNDGRFSIRNVRVGGPYSLTVNMEGFTPYEITGVTVQLGDAVDLRFPLQLEAVEEVVTVVADYSPLINPSRTGASSNVGTELLESLPTVDRNFNSFARTNPFITISAENEDPDAISIAGRSSRYNNISIDGAVNNDLFGLADTGTPGGQSGSTPISLDALEQLEFVIADFDVRNGGFSGGSVNAVTRSGSNAYKGSVFYFTRDDSFFGDGPDDLGPLGDYSEDQYGFRLGGPISQDKIFFFVNADLEERSTPSGWSLDGSSGQCFANCTLTDEAQEFRQFLIDNYGYDPGGLGEDSRDNPSDKYFARLDFNIGDRHQLTARHNYVDAADAVNRPGSFTYEWPSEAYAFQNETNSTVFQLNSALSSNMFNEARISYQTIKDRRGPRNGIDFPWIEIENVRAGGGEFEVGTEPFSTKNALDQDILEIHDDLTWISGDHTVTFGTHNELFSFSNLFIQNAFGSYEFNGLDDFYAGEVRRFQYTIVPEGFNERQEFDVNQLGFYVGDQWTARPNLTLNLGLRVDVPFFPDAPANNPFAEATYGYSTSDIPDGEQLWQPRFGFNWDPSANGKGQLRGGVGIFAGRTPYVWISNNYARTGLEQIFVSCSGGAAPEFSADPNNQPFECGGAGGAIGEFNFIDPNFKFPQVLRYNLAYDYELPVWGLVASVEAIYTDSLKEIDYQNVNVRQTGQLTFDGRPLYETVDSDVDGAYLITNTDQGEATNLAVKLEKPFSSGFWGYVSYAYTDSKVVNEGSSSRAVSNWRFNEAFDPNNAGVSHSDYEVEHRFNASLSYRLNRSTEFPTTVSLFYNHQSGRPFSWLMGSDFVGDGWFGDSYNGDGFDSNDLLYVPANEGDVIIVGGGTWAELDAWISQFPELDSARGTVVGRNTGTSPWSHSLDLHIDQDIPVGFGKAQITFDILNLMNLIDEDSGNLRYVNFNSVEILEVEGIADDGTPMVSFRGPLSGFSDLYTVHNTRSRWRAKLGVRWTF